MKWKAANKFRTLVALILVLNLCMVTGCGKQEKQEPPEETVRIEEATEAPTSPKEAETEPEPQPEPETEPVQVQEERNDGLLSLRQSMVETQKIFAVAYFGYYESYDPNQPVDPYAVMQEAEPGLCADLPFLLEIPADRVIGESGELYCIIPLDADATVAVSKGYWDDENSQCIYDDMLYSSDAGEPILLFCNNAGWEPDTQLYICGESGEVFWYPQKDMHIQEEPNCFILTQPVAPAPVEMEGLWELGWTEVEGDVVGAEPGVCSIEIISSAYSGLLISYISQEFPNNNFYNELMTIDTRQMYDGCGNDEWVADLDYVGPWDTTYAVTLTVDDILIKQNYFLVDGAPMVSYEYFRRAQ